MKAEEEAGLTLRVRIRWIVSVVWKRGESGEERGRGGESRSWWDGLKVKGKWKVEVRALTSSSGSLAGQRRSDDEVKEWDQLVRNQNRARCEPAPIWQRCYLYKSDSMTSWLNDTRALLRRRDNQKTNRVSKLQNPNKLLSENFWFKLFTTRALKSELSKRF